MKLYVSTHETGKTSAAGGAARGHNNSCSFAGGRLIPGARFWGTSCIKANMAFKLLVSDTVGGVEQEVTS